MAITFKEFQSKAEGVEVHPESTDKPWEYALSGLISELGKFSKIVDMGLPKGNLTSEEQERAIESAWKSLWCLAVACRFSGISLEEVAERGKIELDKIGDDHLPK
jgi:hypothetical protein